MEWISVDERLPEVNQHVLAVFRGHRTVREGYISRMTYNENTKKDFDYPAWVDATEQYDGNCGYPDEQYGITHWMPLPAPPTSPPKPLRNLGEA